MIPMCEMQLLDDVAEMRSRFEARRGAIMRRMVLALAPAAMLLASCESVITKHGDDTFTLERMSAACAAGSGSDVLADLRVEAQEHCGQHYDGALAKEKASHSVSGIPGARCASASFTFRCEKQ